MNKRKSAKITKYRKPLNINLGLIIFGIIFIYIIACIVMAFSNERVTPYEVKMGALSVNNTYTGFAIRQEEIVGSSNSGYVNYYAREGERVGVGSMVYTVDESGKLMELVNSGGGGENALSDEDLMELKTFISQFSNEFEAKKFSSVYSFKDEIESAVIKLANYKVLSNIETLQQSGVADSVNYNYAASTGIIVYSTDSYEGVTADTFTDAMLDKESYVKKQMTSDALIAAGDPVYKLVTDENWSVIIKIDDEKAAVLEEEQYVQVRFLKNGYKSWAAVSIIPKEKEIYAKLDFNNSMISYATERYLDVEILTSGKQGLKIPTSAMVEKEFYLIPIEYITKGGDSENDGFLKETYLEDGTVSTEFVETTIYNSTETDYYVDEAAFKIGDYIIKPNSTEKYPVSKKGTLMGVYNINKGYADFKQVTVLHQNKEYAVVRSNTDYGLSVYDHIVLDGKSVNENDFIY